MKINIKAENIINRDQEVNIEIQPPSSCPFCNCNYNPNVLNSFYLQNNSKNYGDLFVVYFCTHCEKCFLVVYLADNLDQYLYQSSGKPHSIFPYPSETRKFPENINAISQNFSKIYNESFLAEQQSLFEICGMGYRKAIEFLIKDYAILLNKDEKDKIGPMPLGQCIDNYIDNKHIKILTKACAWIGNDETHYIRKHADYDLNSLKSFINAVVSFIDSELEFFKAQHLLNQKK